MEVLWLTTCKRSTKSPQVGLLFVQNYEMKFHKTSICIGEKQHEERKNSAQSFMLSKDCSRQGP